MEKIEGGDNNRAAYNLRRKGIYFHRESAKLKATREKLFVNRVISL